MAAWLGSGDYEYLGVSRDEALDVLRHYFDLLNRQHGTRAQNVLRQIVPELKKELGYERRKDTDRRLTPSEDQPAGTGDEPSTSPAFSARDNTPGEVLGSGPGAAAPYVTLFQIEGLWHPCSRGVIS